MKNQVESKLYEFVFRGLLTEDALDKVGRISKNTLNLADVEDRKNTFNRCIR